MDRMGCSSPLNHSTKIRVILVPWPTSSEASWKIRFWFQFWSCYTSPPPSGSSFPSEEPFMPSSPWPPPGSWQFFCMGFYWKGCWIQESFFELIISNGKLLWNPDDEELARDRAQLSMMKQILEQTNLLLKRIYPGTVLAGPGMNEA